ncbi:hypothetical protein SAZ11_07435 [Streptomyces sp. FXJ1.4098]|nr:hypothetical protein [Streptomyces sp. FXJ1.4098]
MNTTAATFPPSLRTGTTKAAGPTPPAFPAESTDSHDLLGSVRIPATEIHLAAHAGLDPALLDAFLPVASDPSTAGARHLRLGRGPAYYQPRQALPSWAALGSALDRLDREAPGQAPALRHALLDNLHNLAAAGAYTLWHDLTDRPSLTDDPRPAALERLLEGATATAAALHGHPATVPLAPHPGDLALLQTRETGWRTFRELDNPVKIGNELRFLAAHVLAPGPTSPPYSPRCTGRCPSRWPPAPSFPPYSGARSTSTWCAWASTTRHTSPTSTPAAPSATPPPRPAPTATA